MNGQMRSLRVFAIVAALTVPLLTRGGAGAVSANGVATVPQGTQTDAVFARSGAHKVTWSVPTSGATSCYLPEVAYAGALATDGNSGENACPGLPTTGENPGPYPTQVGSNPGYPAGTAMLVKDHSESDIRVDPTNPRHLIGSSKWFVSAEGYNHLLGFYESFDGGSTWPVQGHIPGYEGWTDNTDPVGAFDPWGNYYAFVLPYQFAYNADGSHDFKINPGVEPNPTLPAEAVAVAVRPHSAAVATPPSAAAWVTSHAGHLDTVATYDSVGNAPDKQWITIDDNVASPHYKRVYLMWVDFHSLTAVPYVAYADALQDGTHSDWSGPVALPLGAAHPQGDTYLLPHVAPDGTLFTTLTNFQPKQGFCCASIVLDSSSDGGATWQGPTTVATGIVPPGATYTTTTFRSGIENSFAVGQGVQGSALYVAWEDNSAGVANVLLSMSPDKGATWTSPIQVNDNTTPADEFQPNLAAAPDGTVSVAFYDRRLPCPTAGQAALTAGLQLDTGTSGTTPPPYGATNYCINAAIQFYGATLAPIGNNIRLSPTTWDPQLNAPHTSGINSATTFIGDYFGNVPDPGIGSEVTTFVSTANDQGTNPAFRQQQVVARVALP